MRAGLDLADKYSYLFLLDTDGAKMIEEGRVRTTPQALRRRFASHQRPLRIALEAGTHYSPWVSRLLEECAHEVLVANARKVRLSSTPEQAQNGRNRRLIRTWPAGGLLTRSSCTRSNIGAKRARPIWP